MAQELTTEENTGKTNETKSSYPELQESNKTLNAKDSIVKVSLAPGVLMKTEEFEKKYIYTKPESNGK